MKIKTDVHYQNQLPKILQLKKKFPGYELLLIYDRKLKTLNNKWIESFKFTYPVTGGENLKDLNNFPQHTERIIKKINSISNRKLLIIAFGGGSVGDFAGFFASVYKRGVPIVQIPSTWLAAMDSAHGGKTALNVEGFKNQVGSFHYPDEIYVVKNLLKSNSEKILKQSYGEFAKTIMLSKNLYKKNETKIWNLLPQIIQVKYNYLTCDPFEKNGERQFLNLGHTVGHVFESVHKLSHGEAVAQGLIFMLEWSLIKKYLSPFEYTKAKEILEKRFKINKCKKKPISKSQFMKTLCKDKKTTKEGKIFFIFLKGLGKPFRSKVSGDEICKEAQRQGWVK